jgi:MoxR-like ATPase
MLQRHQMGTIDQDLQPCITLESVRELQKACRQVQVSAAVQDYILRLVRSTRQDDEITLGVSPRGAVAMQRSAQALAFLQNRDYILPDDVKQLALSVLAHRLIPAGGKNARTVVDRLLQTISVD